MSTFRKWKRQEHFSVYKCLLKLINVSKKKTTEAFIREKNAQTFNRVQSKVIESTMCDYAQLRVTGNTESAW